MFRKKRKESLRSARERRQARRAKRRELKNCYKDLLLLKREAQEKDTWGNMFYPGDLL